MVAEEIMTKDPIYITDETSVEAAIGVLYENDIRHLPVLDSDGELVGIVSDRDLRAFALPALTEFDNRESFNEALANPVSTIMSGDVVSVDLEAELVEIIDIMLQTRAGAIPVIDRDTAELVGIISYVDVLGALRDEM